MSETPQHVDNPGYVQPGTGQGLRSGYPILRYFSYAHLPEGPLRDTSATCSDMARMMADELPPGPEVSAGLRHLLEAKDCFVRAAIDIPPHPRS